MNFTRATVAIALILLAGCSEVPTTPANIDAQPAASSSDLRGVLEPASMGGGGFGSGTITSGLAIDSNATDSTTTEITRGPNGFGSGT
jgi:hypothetical protein